MFTGGTIIAFMVVLTTKRPWPNELSLKKHFIKIVQKSVAFSTFISNEFFTVEKWDINGQADLKKDTSYKLFTVIDGEGEIIVDKVSYPLVKGKNFILPSDVISWTFDGDFSVIVSQK